MRNPFVNMTALFAQPLDSNSPEWAVKLPDTSQQELYRLRDLAKAMNCPIREIEGNLYFVATQIRIRKLIAIFQGGYEVHPKARAWSFLRHPLRPQKATIAEALRFCKGGILEGMEKDTRRTGSEPIKEGPPTRGHNTIVGERILKGEYASLPIDQVCLLYRKETGLKLSPDSVRATVVKLRKQHGAPSGR